MPELNEEHFEVIDRNKDKKHITRQGKWTDKSRYWTSKQGANLMTYFDIDKDAYRTAKGSWKVRL